MAWAVCPIAVLWLTVKGAKNSKKVWCSESHFHHLSACSYSATVFLASEGRYLPLDSKTSSFVSGTWMHSLIDQSESLSCTVNWLIYDSLKFISVCSYVYACSHMFECMCSYMYVEAWDQRWVLFFRFHPPLVFRQGLPLARILASRLDWMAREPQEPTCLCLLTSIPRGSAFQKRSIFIIEDFIQYSMVTLTYFSPTFSYTLLIDKIQSFGAQPQWVHLQNTLRPKA